MGLLERPLRRRVRFVAGAADPDVMSGPVVPRGEVWRVVRYAWEPETDQLNNCRSFVDGHGYRHFLQEWVAPANGFLYVDPRELWLGESESLQLLLEGIDAGDVLQLYIDGIRIFDEDIEALNNG